MLRPEKIIENIMRHLGSITMNLMTAPDCLPQLDGTCFGSRIGIAINLILQPWSISCICKYKLKIIKLITVLCNVINIAISQI